MLDVRAAGSKRTGVCMLLRYGWVLPALVLAGCSQAPQAPAPQPAPSKLEGMWSDPLPTAVGTFCFFACTDAGIDRLNALLDDPANDSRPYPELRAAADRHQRENYLRPSSRPRRSRPTRSIRPTIQGFSTVSHGASPNRCSRPSTRDQAGRGRTDRVASGKWEAVRTVSLDGGRAANQPPSRLGHSVGRFDGRPSSSRRQE